MRSLKTNAVMKTTPCHNMPCGKKMSAPAHTPMVPTRVTASGLMPSLRNSMTKGLSTTPCQKPLKRSRTELLSRFPSGTGAGYP